VYINKKKIKDINIATKAKKNSFEVIYPFSEEDRRLDFSLSLNKIKKPIGFINIDISRIDKNGEKEEYFVKGNGIKIQTVVNVDKSVLDKMVDMFKEKFTEETKYREIETKVVELNENPIAILVNGGVYTGGGGNEGGASI